MSEVVKAQPVLSDEAISVLEMLDSCELDLAQLRLLEREILARKRAKLPKRGEMNPATAKALDKHRALFNNTNSWIESGNVERVKLESAVLPKSLLQLLMKDRKVPLRSKITEKPAMIAALIATAPVALAQAA